MVAMVTMHVFVQMFNILRPDCNGVLTVDELHKLPTDRYKMADKFFEDSLGIIENINEADDNYDDSIISDDGGEHDDSSISDDTRCVVYTTITLLL